MAAAGDGHGSRLQWLAARPGRSRFRLSLPGMRSDVSATSDRALRFIIVGGPIGSPVHAPPPGLPNTGALQCDTAEVRAFDELVGRLPAHRPPPWCISFAQRGHSPTVSIGFGLVVPPPPLACIRNTDGRCVVRLRCVCESPGLRRVCSPVVWPGSL